MPAPGTVQQPPPTLLRQRVPARWTVFSTALLSLLIVSLWLRATSPNRGQPPPTTVRASSVAVLPFVNTSPDVADNYLGYGIGAELTQALTWARSLHVAARSSAFAPRQAGGDPRLAGRRLGVATVLVGTVRRSGERLRVTARLIDVEEGFDIWSEAYERPAGELFDIQREIRNAVATALRPGEFLDSVPSPGLPAGFSAYDAYLAGRYELERPTPGNNRRAVAHLTRAVRLDSTFARAYAALGDAYMRSGGAEAMSPLTTVPLAKDAVVRALQLDSTMAYAHSVLGTIRFVFDRNWSGAEAQFRRALALEPAAPDLHPPYARYLLAMGRIDESRAVAERALEASPLSPELTALLGWHYLNARQFDQARETLQRAIAMDSAAWRPYFDLALLELAAGDYPAAERHLRVPRAAFPQRADIQAAEAQLRAAEGRKDEAHSLLQQLEEAAADRYISPYLIASVQASLGQRREAFASLDRAVKERSEGIAYLRVDPRMDSLRRDRRFSLLLRRLRLP